MQLSLSLGALCQCFTLVSFCTAIADPNWITVQNGTDTKQQLIYGVSFVLHNVQNLTNTAPLGGLRGTGMLLLYTLTALCYGVLLFSSSSFLLDFIGVGIKRPRLMAFLYTFIAVLCLAALSVSGQCLYVIQQNVQKVGVTWPQNSPLAPSGGLETSAGDSMCIAAVGLVFSFMAVAFSFCCTPQVPTPRQSLSEEAWGNEDREPLIARPNEGTAEWGEA